MGLSSWLCTNNTKNMLVKIVHPGGHVELHDRPVLAAEIMLRNPRCCVTHPHVFQQPWTVIPPDTMLMLGQKFYVVPVSTIRKLQRNSLKQSPSPLQGARPHQDEDDEGTMSSCCMFMNQDTPNSSYKCLNQSDDDGDKQKCLSDGNCLMCLLLSGDKGKDDGEEDSKVDAGSTNTGETSERREPNRERSKDNAGKGKKESSKRHLFSSYQPSLESINEE